eukprot:scaffold101265_cov18-Tisochrysis_lutea.AAC.1
MPLTWRGVSVDLRGRLRGVWSETSFIGHGAEASHCQGGAMQREGLAVESLKTSASFSFATLA